MNKVIQSKVRVTNLTLVSGINLEDALGIWVLGCLGADDRITPKASERKCTTISTTLCFLEEAYSLCW
jgi:hypothetical protein